VIGLSRVNFFHENRRIMCVIIVLGIMAFSNGKVKTSPKPIAYFVFSRFG